MVNKKFDEKNVVIAGSPAKIIKRDVNPIKAGNNWIELKDSNRKIIPINKIVRGNILTIKPVRPLNKDNFRLILHTACLT